MNAISVPGTIKSWIVDNVIVSRFSWPLLVNDSPQSVVQNWSNRCTCVSFYKKMAENEQMCLNFDSFQKSARKLWARI